MKTLNLQSAVVYIYFPAHVTCWISYQPFWHCCQEAPAVNDQQAMSRANFRALILGFGKAGATLALRSICWGRAAVAGLCSHLLSALAHALFLSTAHLPSLLCHHHHTPNGWLVDQVKAAICYVTVIPCHIFASDFSTFILFYIWDSFKCLSWPHFQPGCVCTFHLPLLPFQQKYHILTILNPKKGQ